MRWDGPLGRVPVHEVVHAIAPELPHDRDGLMAPRLGRTALLRRTPVFRAGLLIPSEAIPQGASTLTALRQVE